MTPAEQDESAQAGVAAAAGHRPGRRVHWLSCSSDLVMVAYIGQIATRCTAIHLGSTASSSSRSRRRLVGMGLSTVTMNLFGAHG
jgi:hypothetical protein